MTAVRIYTKPGCPYCAKAKALLAEKHASYQETDITTFPNWQAKLREITGRQTVPQIYIGETHVGGYDDLAALNVRGELDLLLGIKAAAVRQELYDILIIGSGPAGMTAAIYAARMKLKIAIVTIDVGGQINLTQGIENYPGYGAIDAKNLVSDFRQHVASYKVPLFTGEKVLSIEPAHTNKKVKTESGKEFFARALIIASGRNPRRLRVPEEAELIGRGITFCGICDGPLFEGKSIAVIGGGNSGFEEALEMVKFATDVHLISDKILAQQILVDRVEREEKIKLHIGYTVTRFAGQDQLQGLYLRKLDDDKEERLDVEGAFIKIGMEPNTAFAIDLLNTNESGEIMVNCYGETGSQGVFAAGDVAGGSENQIVIAAGKGAEAAVKASKYLVNQR